MGNILMRFFSEAAEILAVVKIDIFYPTWVLIVPRLVISLTLSESRQTTIFPVSYDYIHDICVISRSLNRVMCFQIAERTKKKQKFNLNFFGIEIFYTLISHSFQFSYE